MFEDSEDDGGITSEININHTLIEQDFRAQAKKTYEYYTSQLKNRFKWLRPSLFKKELGLNLAADAKSLIEVLKVCGTWDTGKDAKLDALLKIISKQHPNEKVIIFSQFADTVDYLAEQLKKRGIESIEGVTGDSPDPTSAAWRFSPISNEKTDIISNVQELRVLVATDVLSEGQNLQDAHVVINYDLPWAIIRLVQRAGRVDRIGQKAEKILCYSFLPADGVERIIRLRSRVRQRLHENAEVVGTDEEFFEDDAKGQPILDLYNEKAGILDRRCGW